MKTHTDLQLLCLPFWEISQVRFQLLLLPVSLFQLLVANFFVWCCLPPVKAAFRQWAIATASMVFNLITTAAVPPRSVARRGRPAAAAAAALQNIHGSLSLQITLVQIFKLAAVTHSVTIATRSRDVKISWKMVWNSDHELWYSKTLIILVRWTC